MTRTNPIHVLTGFLMAGMLAVSCSMEEPYGNEDYALFYPGINEICPGTVVNLTPTWRGGTPGEFAISAVRFDGSPFSTDCFSVDPETGVFSISGSDGLATGEYSIDIACSFNGVRRIFSDAIRISMMKPVPDGIVVEPSSLQIRLTDVVSTGDEVELPTARIKTDGSNHVQIKGYSIANVRFNGEIANGCKDWFSLSETGEFSIVPDNPDFEAGLYTFDFKLMTYVVGANSEEGIFQEALSLNVTSVPAVVEYSPSDSRVEWGVAGRSAEPYYKGSRDGLKYSVRSVSPEDPGITVDESTGVLHFPGSSETEVGDTYTVSLTVANDYGTTDFDDVYTFTVISFIEPITSFSYADVTDKISGVSISNPVAGIVGDEVTFAFVDLPAALEGLEIDPQTGTVTCEKGVEIVPGDYTVTVSATNVKGSMNASFRLNIVENPYYFTYVRWGNNLGLEPYEDYADQFRIYHGDAKIRQEIVDSDIPEGAPVKYSFVKAEDSGTSMGLGFAVSASSGFIEIYSKTAGTAKSFVDYAFVNVTVGGDSEAAVTRRFPVFIHYCGPVGGVIVEYNPFVVQVNPKTGGRSAVPVIKDADKTPMEDYTLSLDFSVNAAYRNLGGPAEHNETNYGLVKNEESPFLKNVWERYFSAVGKTYNKGSRSPMSYWDNYANSWLDLAAGYVNKDDLRVVINPEKFVDQYGYADGVLHMIMKQSLTGESPHNDTKNQEVTPIVILFDPDYTE